MKPIIAHITHSYLPISATFIYSYITNIKKYESIIIAREIQNLDLFPIQNLYCAPRFARYSLQWIHDKIFQKVLKRELFHEYIMKKEKAKLIHAHFGPQGVQMIKAKRKLGLPLVTTFYGYDMSRLTRKWRWRLAYKRLFKEGDIFLVEGNHMKENLIRLGCPPQKINVHHIGVDVSKFIKRNLSMEDNKIIILFCGRLTEKKGLIYGLRAIKTLANISPNLEFRIIGDGELRPEIENYIKEENIGDKVILLGYQPYHIFEKEVQKAHILLQPSITAQNGDSEGGAPVVLLEAQASGLVVVSTYHADIPEVVLDGKSGFLVKERDSKSIAKKIEYLIENPELRIEMGRIGRKHVEKNYNIYDQIRKLESIYNQLI